MVYSLTEKLKFEDNPKIEISGKTLEVKADAETVLELIDLLQTRGEMAATTQSINILFSEKDQKTIKGLKLSFADYTMLLEAAVSLALGEDPDEDASVGQASHTTI